jgi:hypothetical protein
MTARIGKRTPTFETYVSPSHWRQHLKPPAKWMLIVVALVYIGGMVAGIIERVWP